MTLGGSELRLRLLDGVEGTVHMYHVYAIDATPRRFETKDDSYPSYYARLVEHPEVQELERDVRRRRQRQVLRREHV